MRTDWRLKRVGVRAANDGTGEHRCLKCGGRWWANLRRGGGYYRGWWKCPWGCNAHLRNISRPAVMIDD